MKDDKLNRNHKQIEQGIQSHSYFVGRRKVLENNLVNGGRVFSVEKIRLSDGLTISELMSKLIQSIVLYANLGVYRINNTSKMKVSGNHIVSQNLTLLLNGIHLRKFKGMSIPRRSKLVGIKKKKWIIFTIDSKDVKMVEIEMEGLWG